MPLWSDQPSGIARWRPHLYRLSLNVSRSFPLFPCSNFFRFLFVFCEILLEFSFWDLTPFLFFLFILVCLPLEGTTLHPPRGKLKDQWACSLPPDFGGCKWTQFFFNFLALLKKWKGSMGSWQGLLAVGIWGKTTSPLILPLPSRGVESSPFKGKTNKNKQKEKKGS